MDIRSRFSEESLKEISRILQENENKSIILKATFDENELIKNPIFLAENKKKVLENITTNFKREEVYIRVAKGNQLYPSDLELEISEDLYNKKNVAFCILSNKLDDFYFVQDMDRINLDKIDIAPFFEKEGVLAKSIKNFEYREEQKSMALSVQRGINENKKIVVEAGTGTGKTLAYLIPAIKWAIQNQKKIIIATNTINLQEQLLYKDIPIVRSIIDEKFSYALVKGRNNYLCKRLFNEVSIKGNVDLDLFGSESKEQLEHILKWGNKTETGDKSELPFEVNGDVWELVQSTTELCIGKKCPHRKQCFYMRTRREKIDANVLIANHHLFFADLNVRANTDFDSEYLILPKYDMVIFDEAHNIESVARSYFSMEISKFSFNRLVNRIFSKSNKRKQKPALNRLEESVDRANLENPGIYDLTLENIKDSIQVLQIVAEEYFEELRKVFDNGNENGVKKVLTSYEMKKSNFLESSREKKEKFQNLLKDFMNLLETFLNLLDGEKDKNPDIINFKNHINIYKAFIDSFLFINNLSEEEYIYWIDINAKRTNVVLTATPLNIAKRLNTSLFENINRLVFASATLTADRNFNYFKKSIGLLEEECIEEIIDSPFNYDEQMKVYIPTNIQDSDKLDLFYEDAANFILSILLKTQGKAFILFTSYTMLNQVYYSIKNELLENNFEIFLHGEKPRSQLITEFKKAINPILFGTTSFWEGVDVQGDNLSNVIIVKLPFLVPTDPIVSAISKKIEEEGGNSFFDYQLPEALIKFKQGIGRLIRNKTDKGNIFILDNRMIKKNYGVSFINAIPTKKLKILTKNEIIKLID
ncbi:helicase C-terminal domain-containing protein [Fusobacterium gastrosuis]|uniref:helicase C-terminal domain-containing protein n=1 Tax=Fusobacterium gastrosuis TaxID=1755100 RepID=UPI00297A6E46|nr:ATP-dependent DNA helicase [Fusobacteriaceae bacterium]MDY5713154.1 ATP-dependent DNA helicase [Fusobacterium gastrosuis]